MRRWASNDGANLHRRADDKRDGSRVQTAAGWTRRLWSEMTRDRRQPIRVLMLAVMGLPAGMMLLAAGSVDVAEAGADSSAAEVVSVTGEWDDAVARAWRQKMVERERERAKEEFAAEFSIPSDLAEKIYVAAKNHAIEPEVAFGLVRAESSFRRTVVSHAGAVGYTQLLPSTARWIAPGTTRASLFNPETNLDVGFRYLRYLKDKYEGNVDLALTAYNRGQGRVDRDLRAGRNPDNGYAQAVRTGHVSQTLARQNSPRRRG
jgi:soluble lytic murein transglycosylase-like protein